MDIYRQVILDHYKNPRNFGHLENPEVVAEDHNVSCGDRITMEVKFTGRRDSLEVAEVRFWGEGCAISQASASLLTEKVKGMKVAKIIKLSTRDILDMLSTTLTPTRIKCAVLPLEVLQKAVAKKTSNVI